MSKSIQDLSRWLKDVEHYVGQDPCISVSVFSDKSFCIEWFCPEDGYNTDTYKVDEDDLGDIDATDLPYEDPAKIANMLLNARAKAKIIP